MATMKSMKLYISVFVVYLIEFCVSKESTKPIEITEDNWTDILKGEWMLEFHAPWCPACKNFQSTWEALAKWSDDLDVGIGQTDVTENPGLSGRFFVTALPTIYHVKDGVFRVYSGSRNENDIISFIDEKKYLELDPVSWLTDPKSLQMSAVGMFFKAAMVIRNIYNVMISDYGIPEWGCYIIFALLTIVFGLLFGLILVCCCDLLFPPKYIQRQQRVQPEAEKMDESDLLDDTPQENGEEETTEDTTDQSKVRKRQTRRD
ncbi:hypothetical protein LOTGIDRAFT_235240 [Lottia gigantea]|uniref:Thioredoxin-related transmembrane protein 1 n=1 Tax=Lottia gigantea TaxID=225164 RepID=V4A0S9_LOTGI|nr:hypothetical protein LOTGIDRAFT_235240 [Lottia gigantea]ESO86866.1 hypothetical protein LOTGIDRAFT_235240 [Lottia gigantea]